MVAATSTRKQRRDALLSAISFHKPLAALSLFLGVVALEDFVRDLVARMAEHPDLTRMFPQLAGLRSQPRARAPDQAFRRLDTDPAGVVDPEEINAVFQQALGIAPIDPLEYWHLRDLALLRHTVAHHAALIGRSTRLDSATSLSILVGLSTRHRPSSRPNCTISIGWAAPSRKPFKSPFSGKRSALSGPAGRRRLTRASRIS